MLARHWASASIPELPAVLAIILSAEVMLDLEEVVGSTPCLLEKLVSENKRGPHLKSLRLFAVLSFLLSTSASAQHPNSTSLTSNPVYGKNCAKCHGKTAEGRHFGGPSLVSDKVANESVDDLRTIITHGKGRMPHFDSKLSTGDIDALVLQIKAANAK
jgi:cytochrome c5